MSATPAATLVPLEPGEHTWLFERRPVQRPVVVKVLLGILLGPAVALTLLGAPIAGWLLRSWVVALALVAGAAATAGLGWLIAALTRQLAAAHDVSVQLTTARAITSAHGRLDEVRWSEVTGVAAIRGPGADVVGEVTWLDVAAFAVEFAVDAAQAAQAPTTPAYWSGATGLRLKTRSGRTLNVLTPAAPAAGLEVVQALAARRAPGTPQAKGPSRPVSP